MVEFNQWHIEELQLDLDSNTQGAIPVIYGRQGDKNGILCNIELTQQGVPVQHSWFTGKRVYFESRGNGVSVRKQADEIEEGIVKVVLPESVFSNIGLVKENFLRIEDASTGDTIISGTSSFQVYVRRGDLDPNASDYYLEEIEALANKFKQWFSAISNTVRKDAAATLANKVVELQREKVEVTEYEHNRNIVTSQLAQKSEKTYVDTMLSSIASGGPRELFYSLSALEAKYPTGEEGTYLVFDVIHENSAHSYIWNGTIWEDLGPYMGLKVPKKSVSLSELSPQYNIVSDSEIFRNKKIYGYKPSDNTIDIADDPNKSIVKIPILDKGKLVIDRLSINDNQYIFTENNEGKVVFQRQYSLFTNETFNRFGYTITENTIILDFEVMKMNNLPEKVIYIAVMNNKLSSIQMILEDSIDPDILKYFDWRNYKNPIEKNLEKLTENFLNGMELSITKGFILIGYNTTTKKVDIQNNENRAYVKINKVVTSGILEVPKTNITTNQRIVLEDSNGECFYNEGWNTTPKFIEISENSMKIDLAMMGSLHSDVAAIYIGYMRTDVDDWFNHLKDAVSIKQAFPFLALNEDESGSLEESDLIIPPYIPMINGYESYIYFNNLLLKHNLYKTGMDATARPQIDDKVVINGLENYNQLMTILGTSISIPIKSIPNKPQSSYKVMLIGESTSENSIYQQALKGLLDTDESTFEFVGTRTNIFKHEARSGWGSGTLRYLETAPNSTNSFWNPTTQLFDLDYYFTQHPDVAVPDIVLINYGINDVNRYVTDGRGGSQTEHYNYFINQFKAKNPNVKVILGLTHGYSRWSNYWVTSAHDTIMERTQATITDFRDKDYQNIYLNPMYVCIDMRYGMPYESVPTSQYSDVTTLVGTDAVHPNESGYKEEALMTYFAIKNALDME